MVLQALADNAFVETPTQLHQNQTVHMYAAWQLVSLHHRFTSMRPRATTLTHAYAVVTNMWLLSL